MPLYVGEYLASTMALSPAEHGAFVLLLCFRHNAERMPANEKEFCAVTRMTPHEWRESSENVLRLFEPTIWGTAPADEITGQGTHQRRRPAIPTDIRRAVYNRDGLACVYCGTEEGPFDLDHKQPWSRGGQHTVDNLCVACASCNRSKGAFTAEEWAQ